MAKLEAKTPMETVFLTYLEANASDILKAKIEAGDKTLAGAVTYITNEAEKGKVGTMAMVEDRVVYGWLIHYFEEDSILEPKPPPPRVKLPGNVKPPAPVVKKKPTLQQVEMFSPEILGGKQDGAASKNDTPVEPAGTGSGTPVGPEESPDDESDEDVPDAEDPDDESE